MNAHKTPLEDAPFTAAQRPRRGEAVGGSAITAPRNQFEYIQLLARAGATVLVTKTPFTLSADRRRDPPIAKRVPVQDMEKIVDDSDACPTQPRVAPRGEGFGARMPPDETRCTRRSAPGDVRPQPDQLKEGVEIP